MTADEAAPLGAWAEQWASLPPYLAAHVQLTLLALTIGFVISLPLGILAVRRPRLEAITLGTASVLQTIPGLALMALMVPMLAGLGPPFEALGLAAPPNIGFLPAVIALSLYSVLPMLRNTVTGLSGVDPALREAARGVGMSEFEALRLVELPLALPTIVAGIRTAAVWVVGTATLATPVGAPSLGNPIFAGLQTRNIAAVAVGSLAAAALAIALDSLIRGVESGLAQRSRKRVALAVAGLALILGGAFFASAAARPNAEDGELEVSIGSKSFTEQYILAEIIGQQLAERSDTRVRQVPSLGSVVAFDALVSNSLDLYVDYTGTIWATIFKRNTVEASRQEVLAEVRERLPNEHGIHVLAALGFENTYALALRRESAEALGIRKISDLRDHAANLSVAGDFEFFDRAEWAAIESRYGLRFREERAMDASLMYEAIRNNSVDVIGAYSTDGRIAAYDLVVLEDDRSVIPPYDAILLASDRLVRKRPELADALRRFAGRIDANEMRAMNGRVDLDGESPSTVASEWLRAEGP